MVDFGNLVYAILMSSFGTNQNHFGTIFCFFINLAQNGILGRKKPFFYHFQEMYFYTIKKCNVELVFVWSGFRRPRQGHSMQKKLHFNVPELQKVPQKCQNSAKKCHFWTKLTSKYIVSVWSVCTRTSQGHSVPKMCISNIPELQKVPQKCPFQSKSSSNYI